MPYARLWSGIEEVTGELRLREGREEGKKGQRGRAEREAELLQHNRVPLADWRGSFGAEASCCKRPASESCVSRQRICVGCEVRFSPNFCSMKP